VSAPAASILGLASKPNTDDLREAKSREVIDLLHAAGAALRVYDSVAMEPARSLAPGDVTFCDSAYAAAEGAEAVVRVTESPSPAWPSLAPRHPRAGIALLDAERDLERKLELDQDGADLARGARLRPGGVRFGAGPDGR
jgi:UDPglucose 6-dehydrogenase